MSENTVWSKLRLMPDSLVIENRQKGRNEKKSEWKTLIAILHSIKSLCSEIDVEDDYDIAGEYFKSLDYSFDIRELTEDENARLDRLFQDGYKKYEAFLLKIFSEDTKRDYSMELCLLINDESLNRKGCTVYHCSLMK